VFALTAGLAVLSLTPVESLDAGWDGLVIPPLDAVVVAVGLALDAGRRAPDPDELVLLSLAG